VDSEPKTPQKPRTYLPWFLVWVGVGVGFALGVSVVGIIAVPLALAVTLALVRFGHADHSALGVPVGVGLLALYVAYVQRRGPGTVYWHTSTASGSDQYLDPRPWLVAGILLVLVGVATFVWRERRRS
jgi:hypothetical protein